MIYSLSPHGIVLILCAEDERCIVWLDIDNTLYSASAGISHAMGERIHGEYKRVYPASTTLLIDFPQLTSLEWACLTKRHPSCTIVTTPSMVSLSEGLCVTTKLVSAWRTCEYCLLTFHLWWGRSP